MAAWPPMQLGAGGTLSALIAEVSAHQVRPEEIACVWNALPWLQPRWCPPPRGPTHARITPTGKLQQPATIRQCRARCCSPAVGRGGTAGVAQHGAVRGALGVRCAVAHGMRRVSLVAAAWRGHPTSRRQLRHAGALPCSLPPPPEAARVSREHISPAPAHAHRPCDRHTRPQAPL